MTFDLKELAMLQYDAKLINGLYFILEDANLKIKKQNNNLTIIENVVTKDVIVYDKNKFKNYELSKYLDHEFIDYNGLTDEYYVIRIHRINNKSNKNFVLVNIYNLQNYKLVAKFITPNGYNWFYHHLQTIGNPGKYSHFVCANKLIRIPDIISFDDWNYDCIIAGNIEFLILRDSHRLYYNKTNTVIEYPYELDDTIDNILVFRIWGKPFYFAVNPFNYKMYLQFSNRDYYYNPIYNFIYKALV